MDLFEVAKKAQSDIATEWEDLELFSDYGIKLRITPEKQELDIRFWFTNPSLRIFEKADGWKLIGRFFEEEHLRQSSAVYEVNEHKQLSVIGFSWEFEEEGA